MTTELRQTSDPEVVVAEICANGSLTTTGATFEALAIQVLRIRDGQILLLRDYFSPSGLADLLAT